MAVDDAVTGDDHLSSVSDRSACAHYRADAGRQLLSDGAGTAVVNCDEPQPLLNLKDLNPHHANQYTIQLTARERPPGSGLAGGIRSALSFVFGEPTDLHVQQATRRTQIHNIDTNQLDR
jgi:3-oxoacyl-[acyl-carrier-protein] synthase III